jgi:hypothetical protein
MTNTVQVTADQNGNIIGVYPNSPEKGYVRVEQLVTVINQKGWLKNTKRSAFIKGLITDLQKSGFKAGTQIPGKIIIVESLNPFNEENPDRDLKIAGDTGVICRLDDQPIYRQAFFTPDLNACDDLISHNNMDEIREVMQAAMALSALQTEKPVEADLS